MRPALLALFLLTALARGQQPLASYLHRSRVLLIFAPSESDPRYKQQVDALAHHAADLKERDVVVLPVLIEEGPAITPSTLRVILGPGLPEREQVPTRHRFGIAPDSFVVVLLGKDGGEKLRSHDVVPVARLNPLIDSMPMRQEEIKQRSGR